MWNKCKEIVDYSRYFVGQNADNHYIYAIMMLL